MTRWRQAGPIRSVPTSDRSAVRLVGVACGCKVFVVDGGTLRDRHTSDFALGGHNRKWKWIPGGRVYVELTLTLGGRVDTRDWAINVCHELLEYGMMRFERKTYSSAHDEALGYESDIRAGLSGVPPTLEAALDLVREIMADLWKKLDLS